MVLQATIYASRLLLKCIVDDGGVQDSGEATRIFHWYMTKVGLGIYLAPFIATQRLTVLFCPKF